MLVYTSLLAEAGVSNQEIMVRSKTRKRGFTKVRRTHVKPLISFLCDQIDDQEPVTLDIKGFRKNITFLLLSTYISGKPFSQIM